MMSYGSACCENLVAKKSFEIIYLKWQIESGLKAFCE